MKVLISCEHAVNDIPSEYQGFFRDSGVKLNSHFGYDIGAILVARLLSKHADFFISAEASRLLIDLNRSLHHPKVFSSELNSVSKEEKQKIIHAYYLPYRNQVRERIQEWVKLGFKVLHLSVHSFTPVFRGELRRSEVGLLYDPSRLAEKAFCQRWKHAILELEPHWRVRMNYPYRGVSDGFCTALRNEFGGSYLGLELEINQALFSTKASSEHLARVCKESFLIGC